MTEHGAVRICRDPQCPAHGRYLRRIRRLTVAVTAERARLAHLEERLADPMKIPVLDVHAEDREAAGLQYAEDVLAWQEWRKGAARDERAMGWDRAHTSLCGKVPCREHRNPFVRTRG